MAYKKAPSDHTEFAGGPGLIDAEARKDRTLSPEEELLEIYASNPNDPDTKLEEVDLEYRPLPKPTVWKDPKTARGTN